MSFSPDFLSLIGFTGMMGSAMGFMGVAQNTIVSLAPENIRVKAMSGLHSMYGIASFLAPLAVGYGLKNGMDWKHFFLLTGVVPFLLLLSSPYWVKKNAVLPPEEILQAKNTSRFSFKIFLVCCLLSFYVVAEILVGSRLSLYSIREFGISSSEASRFVTVFFLGLLSGRLFGAFFRWPGTQPQQLVSSLVFSFSFMSLGLYLNPWFFALTGLSMSLFYPVCSSYIAQLYKGQEGVIFSYTIGVQSLLIVLMHVLVGWVSDHFGLKAALHLAFLFLLISGLCLWRIEIENRKIT
jgi:MFS family permease